jgi:hypothetical protein
MRIAYLYWHRRGTDLARLRGFFDRHSASDLRGDFASVPPLELGEHQQDRCPLTEEP